jgi:tRNA(His) 5'-end guanylyltransferase
MIGIMMIDNIGDRMKQYESIEKDRFMSRLPIYARIDGRCFSSFTRGLNKPFDKRMQDNMQKTLESLVLEFSADFGYFQSDEISLFWLNKDREFEQFLFGGVKQKICSVLSGYASSVFSRGTIEFEFPEKKQIPHFDCRVIQMPSEIELWNMLLWRIKDCSRNAIQSTAQSIFSHKSLQGVKTKDIVLMLEDFYQKNINEAIEPNLLNGVSCFKEKYMKDFEEGESLKRTRIVSGYFEKLPPLVKNYGQEEGIFDFIKSNESFVRFSNE